MSSLPACIWELVGLFLPETRDLLSLASVSTDMRALLFDDHFMVRYWRMVNGVWDVLRYKRLNESWSEFFHRADGEKAEFLERLREAEAILEKCDKDRFRGIAMSQRGLVRLTYLRDFLGAKADFLQAMALCEDVRTTGLNNLAVAYLYLGNLSVDLKCYVEAEAILRRSLERGVSSVAAGNLCVALIKQGRFEEAVEAGLAAARLVAGEGPSNANAFHHLGFALYCLSQPAAAVRCCGLAVLLKPRYSEAYFTRGLARKALGMEREANEDFEEALRLSRNASVYSYVHMYASTGEPCHEGFAPRQRASSMDVQSLDAELDRLEEQIRSSTQGELAGMLQQFLRADVDDDDDDEEGEGEDEDDDDEEEEEDSFGN